MPLELILLSKHNYVDVIFSNSVIKKIVFNFLRLVGRALNDSVEASEEEVVYLFLLFFEKLDELCSSLLHGVSSERLSKVLSFSQQTIRNWVQAINDKIHGNSTCVQFQENKLALLYGAVRSFPYVIDVQSNTTLLMDLIDALDQLLLTNSGKDVWVIYFCIDLL